MDRKSAIFSQTLSDRSVLLAFIFLRLLLFFIAAKKAVNGWVFIRLLLMFSVSILVFSARAMPSFVIEKFKSGSMPYNDK